MAIHAAGGDDLALACDHLRARPDDDVDIRLHIRIAGLADCDDAAVLQADIRLHNPPMVEDQRIGDDGVDSSVRARHLALPHAIANDLAAAELHLLAISGEILLDLDEQFRIGQAHLVADRRPEHAGVGGTGNPVGHGSVSLGGRNEVRIDKALETAEGNIAVDKPLLGGKGMLVPTRMAETGNGDIVVGIAGQYLGDDDHAAARHDIRAGLIGGERRIDIVVNGLIDHDMPLACGFAEGGELIGVIVAEIIELRMRDRQGRAQSSEFAGIAHAPDFRS
ncbi:hypothetical protein RHSP_80284 [Rhizobium freirei PRF 81]|uniref:Uncharacterized protein n=1 Tax=Rhizobium freirei PRF 81 TaxID=363754 RepID=N6V9I1_9HYPH|nr:hypothetical protein RHSP_80284 [Rhizobium freirei PRF 81]